MKRAGGITWNFKVLRGRRNHQLELASNLWSWVSPENMFTSVKGLMPGIKNET